MKKEKAVKSKIFARLVDADLRTSILSGQPKVNADVVKTPI